MSSTPAFQEQLFRRLQSQFPSNSELVKALSQLLNLSSSSVYRRLSGEQKLSFSEVVKMAKAYRVSIDAIIDTYDGPIPFYYAPVSRPQTMFEDFVGFVHGQVRKITSPQEARVFISAQDLPSFAYFGYPHLLAFKKYMYGLSILDNGKFKDAAFGPRLVSTEVRQQGKAVADRYLQLSSVDVWGPNLLDTTLRQIEFVAGAGRFEDPRDAHTILDELSDWIASARRMARNGKKTERGGGAAGFSLFINDLLFSGNLVLIKENHRYRVYTVLGNPHILSTSHDSVGEHLASWFDRLTRKAISISVHGDREREKYFNHLTTKVDRTREQLFR